MGGIGINPLNISVFFYSVPLPLRERLTLQPTVIPGQISQVRPYFFSPIPPPPSSSLYILWNLHLTDLEVLDRRNTWNNSEGGKQTNKAARTLRVTLTPHYKAFGSASLRDVQQHGTLPHPHTHVHATTPSKVWAQAPLLSKEPWQLMLRTQFRHVWKSEKIVSLFGKQSFGVVLRHFHKFMKRTDKTTISGVATTKK